MVEEQSDLIQARRQKLAEWRAAGVDPFACERYERTHHAREAVAAFEAREAAAGSEGAEGLRLGPVSLAGRVTAQRIMGKAAFLDLSDETGRIQLYFKSDRLGLEGYAQVRL